MSQFPWASFQSHFPWVSFPKSNSLTQFSWVIFPELVSRVNFRDSVSLSQFPWVCFSDVTPFYKYYSSIFVSSLNNPFVQEETEFQWSPSHLLNIMYLFLQIQCWQFVSQIYHSTWLPRPAETDCFCTFSDGASRIENILVIVSTHDIR